MTQITISDPTEVQAGYWSAEIVEDGDLIAEAHLSPDTLPDFDDPREFREFLEAMAEGVGAAEHMDL
ncbi:hypothetical protein ACFQFH_20040 [Halobaculum halobium]|uniref:Uncharacterized protein n=1 Tax=Halobaculum halobium TaxID=3032281 RepID=A0ABD5TF06_9EURY|nr:hypothetical protein [Halobaculum sp. SYNS20]